jgi:hypothetical protein
VKSLAPDVAEVVAAHLVAAGRLVDEDPELAYRHAEAARRRAPRLPTVREVAAEAAYAAGRFPEALTEYRTLRRMTGSGDVIPVMADCLRATGKPRDALELIEEGLREVRDPAMAVELRIVQAGARADLGQTDEAGRLLRRLIEQPPPGAPPAATARAWAAWATHELGLGHDDEARRGFERALRLDPEGQAEALDDIDGLVLELDEEAIIGEDGDDSDHEDDGGQGWDDDSDEDDIDVDDLDMDDLDPDLAAEQAVEGGFSDDEADEDDLDLDPDLQDEQAVEDGFGDDEVGVDDLDADLDLDDFDPDLEGDHAVEDAFGDDEGDA